jgi:hypothetical protein
MTTFWLDDPNILISSFEIWPTNDMNETAKYNAITRLVICLTILGFILTKNIKLLLVCFVTLGIITFINKNNSTNESFLSHMVDANAHKNPFNNNTPTDLSKPPAPLAYEPHIKEQIKTNVKKIISTINPDIDKRLFRDIGDDINFEQSLNTFYTTASSQQPNDQAEFAKFCYSNLACDKDTLKTI